MIAASLADEAARLSRSAAHVALCVDFDGTLAPIVDDPNSSRPIAGAVELLTRLVKRYATVALVSGRPASFLAERAPASGVRFLGLYGLEEIVDGRLWVDSRLEAARPAVAAATADLEHNQTVQSSGAFLEDKTYAIAVHTRRIAEPERWASSIDTAVRAVAVRHGLEIIPGRLVWELRPALRGDKGDAVRRVAAESNARSLVVIGDDLGDIPAFAAATRFASEGNAALCVAVRSDESPSTLLDAADIVVDGPHGVMQFLELLAAV